MKFIVIKRFHNHVKLNLKKDKIQHWMRKGTIILGQDCKLYGDDALKTCQRKENKPTKWERGRSGCDRKKTQANEPRAVVLMF